jgi:hypothetical protein
MCSAAHTVPVAAPVGWNPQTTITTRFPEIAELGRTTLGEIRVVEARLDRDEAGGRDVRCLRQILRELRWRLQYTSDATGINATLARLRSLAAQSSPPATALRGPDSADGICTCVWFLKLDACVDHMLANNSDDGARPPRFLDRLNNPSRLKDYLDALLVSHPEEDGIDRRKELNLATANLVRLILWRRPPDYPWDARLEAVIRRFVAEWQDPTTGFFGADYMIGGCRYRTADLSLTFHMARYLKGDIGYWPQLIDTLLSIREHRYPNGWLDEIGITSHNNYDVAVLLALGWPHMRADQRRRGAAELTRLLDWCLTGAIAPDGEIAARALGESLPESYYFTIAFLDTVGYFDRAKRFWTELDFPQAQALQVRLEDRLLMLPESDPMTRMARVRLGRSPVSGQSG